MSTPEHRALRFSPRALRILELLLLLLALSGVLSFVAAVYFVWNGVAWYKLGGLVTSAALIILSAFVGLLNVRARRRIISTEPKIL